MILLNCLANGGYLAQLVKEDLTLAIFLLVPIWLQTYVPPVMMEFTDSYAHEVFVILTNRCLSLAIKESVLVLALARSHALVMFCTSCLVLPVATRVSIESAEDVILSMLGLVVAAHLATCLLTFGNALRFVCHDSGSEVASTSLIRV